MGQNINFEIIELYDVQNICMSDDILWSGLSILLLPEKKIY